MATPHTIDLSSCRDGLHECVGVRPVYDDCSQSPGHSFVAACVAQLGKPDECGGVGACIIGTCCF